MNSNERKAAALGEAHGTANAKLKKSLLFKFAQLLGLDKCFQCGEPITLIEQFSIEHKIPWQNSPNPVESFYDINNIAFSHTLCNIKAGMRHKKYDTAAEQNRQSFKRYYDRNSAEFLEKKRERYHKQKA